MPAHTVSAASKSRSEAGMEAYGRRDALREQLYLFNERVSFRGRSRMKKAKTYIVDITVEDSRTFTVEAVDTDAARRMARDKYRATGERANIIKVDAWLYRDPNKGKGGFEVGWQQFKVGDRVEVRTDHDIWRRGEVMSTPRENDRAIEVRCDQEWSDNLEYYAGHGATVHFYMSTNILQNIRKEVVSPKRKVGIA